jgi:hypothetical protein
VPTRIGEPQPTPTRVDVWLGTRIQLAELRISAGVEVASGGEIEQFALQSQKRAAKVVAPQEAIAQGGNEFVSAEFRVASAGWTLAPLRSGQPRGLVMLAMGEKLTNGGRFYVMLWGDAVGSSETSAEFQDSGCATSRIRVACQNRHPRLLHDDRRPADIQVVK